MGKGKEVSLEANKIPAEFLKLNFITHLPHIFNSDMWSKQTI